MVIDFITGIKGSTAERFRPVFYKWQFIMKVHLLQEYGDKVT